jgi:hypothetical protein
VLVAGVDAVSRGDEEALARLGALNARSSMRTNPKAPRVSTAVSSWVSLMVSAPTTSAQVPVIDPVVNVISFVTAGDGATKT